jgi:hypothetical protein
MGFDFSTASDSTPNPLSYFSELSEDYEKYRPIHPASAIDVTDSTAGLVWRINTQNQTATIWLQDESLRPQTPESRFPGANGIKVFEGAAYVSNSDRRQIVRIPMEPQVNRNYLLLIQ